MQDGCPLVRETCPETENHFHNPLSILLSVFNPIEQILKPRLVSRPWNAAAKVGAAIQDLYKD